MWRNIYQPSEFEDPHLIDALNDYIEKLPDSFCVWELTKEDNPVDLYMKTINITRIPYFYP